MEDLKKSGECRFIGASVYGEEAALLAIEAGRYDCLQVAYSILDRRPERATLAAAKRNDVGIVARSVLLKGALTYRYRDLPNDLAALKAAVERMIALTGAGIHELPSLAYRYVLSQENLHSALVGASTKEELMAATEYSSQGPLPFEVVQKIREMELDRDELLNPAKWGVNSDRKRRALEQPGRSERRRRR